jgi:acyl-homoserine-lactone acylase
VAWGDIQYTLKGEERFSVPGGYGAAGAVNVVAYSRDGTTLLPTIPRARVVHASTGLTEDGYLITYGPSTMMAIEFTDEGVRADGILTFSQSADPDSPHFADQTELYSRDGWRKVLFTEEEIASDPNLVTERVTSD